VTPAHPAHSAGPSIPESNDLLKLDKLKLEFKDFDYKMTSHNKPGFIMQDEFKLPKVPDTIFKSGAAKQVFAHPTDKSKLVKVVDPSNPVAKELLEREYAVYHYLIQIEEAYLKAGLRPPFKVARIHSTEEQWRKGIIIQDLVEGTPMASTWAASKTGSTPDYFNRFVNEIDRHHQVVSDATAEARNIAMKVPYGTTNRDGMLFRNSEQTMGIDWGADFNNAKLVQHPDYPDAPMPVLYDW
jgi:hypothetical protein